jgi:hypothetical protein
MEARLLFHHRFKIIGWIITIPSIIAGLFYTTNGFEGYLNIEIKNDKLGQFFANYSDEIIIVALIIGLLLIAFSKIKIEDEFSSKVRLESLQWAIYVNYAIFILATLFVYDFDYLDVIVYNTFTPMIIFIIRFHYVLFIKPKLENIS